MRQVHGAPESQLRTVSRGHPQVSLRLPLHRSWLAWLAASQRRQLRRVALWDPQAVVSQVSSAPGEDCPCEPPVA